MSINEIGALERGDRRYPYRETVALLAKALGLAALPRLSLRPLRHVRDCRTTESPPDSPSMTERASGRIFRLRGRA